jgi:hypothetical protein
MMTGMPGMRDAKNSLPPSDEEAAARQRSTEGKR